MVGDIYRVRKKRNCGGFVVFGSVKFPTLVDGEV